MSSFLASNILVVKKSHEEMGDFVPTSAHTRVSQESSKSADYSRGKWAQTLLLELCSFARYLSGLWEKKESGPGWDHLAQCLEQTS